MNHIKRATIAGVVLCLDEAANLPRALRSLDWCDELLMIDSGSSDGSQTIASSLGARVIEHRQQGRFLISEQRNWAISHGQLQSQWVLFLDADEAISTRCRSAIEKATNHTATADAY